MSRVFLQFLGVALFIAIGTAGPLDGIMDKLLGKDQTAQRNGNNNNGNQPQLPSYCTLERGGEYKFCCKPPQNSTRTGTGSNNAGNSRAQARNNGSNTDDWRQAFNQVLAELNEKFKQLPDNNLCFLKPSGKYCCTDYPDSMRRNG